MPGADQPPTAGSAGYSTPAADARIEYQIKKSRFIAWACLATDRAQALAVLERAKQQFPDARHHCWAYLIGPPRSPRTVAMSDDGEPSGTAGKPILNVLQHKGVGDIMLVVSRYFGGIKLGAGGLVRAYSHAAQDAMEQLPLTQHIELKQLQIHCDFALEHAIRHWLDSHQGHIDEISYQSQVLMRCTLPESQLADWQSFADNHQLSSRLL